MKVRILLSLLAAGGMMLCSCQSHKSDAPLSSEDSLKQALEADTPYAEPAQTNSNEVSLGGKSYKVSISRKADPAQPVVTDELGKQFYDNTVSVRVTCGDATVFERIYTKEAFSDFLSADEKQGTVLLGMACDASHSDAQTLRLGAQIGQVGIGEGPAFIVEIPLGGGASTIVRDKNQDTSMEEGMTD